MFRKVLGFGAFAIGGVVAFKLVVLMLGMLLALVSKILFLALVSVAVFGVYKFFTSSVFNDGSSKKTDEVEVEIEVETEEDSGDADVDQGDEGDQGADE